VLNIGCGNGKMMEYKDEMMGIVPKKFIKEGCGERDFFKKPSPRLFPVSIRSCPYCLL